MATDKGVSADAQALLHGRQTAEDGIVADLNVSADCGVIDQGHVIADDAVVGDVGADHQEAVAADAGLHPAADGAAMDGHLLAYDAVLAD